MSENQLAEPFTVFKQSWLIDWLKVGEIREEGETAVKEKGRREI